MPSQSQWAVISIFVLGSSIPQIARPSVITFEPDSFFPESASNPWERVGTLDATRWLFDGRLWIDVDMGVWGPDPYGERDFYQRSISDFSGAGFCIEWRCRSTAPESETEGGGGCLVSTWGCCAHYQFVVTTNHVQLHRSNFLPILHFDIQAETPHTYRLEQFGAMIYKVFIDGVLVDSGQPQAGLPQSCGNILWGSSVYLDSSLNDWDYVRYGTIPRANSGDFDSDGMVDDNDLYFFVDCLLGPAYDAAGPSCAWADMNADGRADGADIQAFLIAMLNS